ncbi:MAG: thiol-disulfide isomerase, partial [Bryobacteraceae bacterium]
LTEAQIKTLVAWADSGAPEGDAKDRPAPMQFQDGWNIKPDMVIEMPNEYELPATGVIDYQNFLVKVNFKEDVWIQAAEIRPGNRQVVHHARAYVVPPGSHFADGAEPGVAFVKPVGRPTQSAQPRAGAVLAGPSTEILAKWNPGLEAQDFTVEGAAKFIPKGSDIAFEMHYTTIGKVATDKTKVGLVLAKTPPNRRYLTSGNLGNSNFTLKPGDSNAEVREEVVIQDKADLVWVQPHMHLRGKDYELQAFYPTGESETLLKAKFDFNWQLGYEFAKPVELPKGTRLVGISHFDNSANNPFNPDSKAEVHWGRQSFDEMSVGFFSVIVDVNANPAKLIRRAAGTGVALE